MSGVLGVDKPSDFTSVDVVAVVRRLSGQRKIGHTGTLDPNATGVLPLLLGNATKAQDIVPNHDKDYTATFKLGVATDTLDIWGEVREEKECRFTREDIERLIPEFSGEIEQIPPMYSAVSVNGQRLYDLARKGIEVERKARKVTVYRLSLAAFDETEQSGTLEISCSRGTYIRTIIGDIGDRLGSGAVMTSLRRTAACGYTLGDSLTLDEIKKLAENGELEQRVRSTESIFVTYPELFVSEAQSKRFRNGGALDLVRTRLRGQDIPEGSIYRVKDGEIFLGLGIIRENSIKIFKLF